MESIKTLMTGTAGVAGVEIANNVDLSVIGTAHEATSLLLQIIIAISTLVGIFKRKRKLE